MDVDSASNSESERNFNMASRSQSSEVSNLQNGIEYGNHIKPDSSSNSNNLSSRSICRSQSMSLGALMSTCPVSADAFNGLSERSNNRTNVWGTPSSSNEELNSSTLMSNGHCGAWTVLESSVHALKGSQRNGSCSTGAVQMVSNQSTNCSLSSSWGSLHENCGSQLNGTWKRSWSGQPQNPNHEVNGSNITTTNFMISSLPNSAGSMQTAELAGNSGPGAWGRSAKSNWPQSPASPVTNGTSILYLSNGDTKIGGTPGTRWNTYGPRYSIDTCSDSNCQANNDTVNAISMQPGLSTTSNLNLEISEDQRTGTWEIAGMGNSQNGAWGPRSRMGPGGNRRGSAQNTNKIDGEWNKLPGNHSSEAVSGNGKMFTNEWVSTKERKAYVDPKCYTAPQAMEQNSGWTKANAINSDSNPEGLKEQFTTEGASHERRKIDQQILLQSIVNQTDLDPCVLSHAGWGQTPIKQNIAWDTEVDPKGKKKADNGTEAWGAQVCSSGGAVKKPHLHRHSPSSGTGWDEPKSVTRWRDSRVSSSQRDWEEGTAPVLDKNSQSWVTGREVWCSPLIWSNTEKLKQGWGDGPKASPGWAVPAVDSCGENMRNNHWGELKKSSSGSSDSDRSVSCWKELGRSSFGHLGGWNGSSIKLYNGSEWETAKPNQSPVWGESPKPNHSKSWGEASKPSGVPDWSKQQNVGCWGGPSAAAASKPSGKGWLERPTQALVKEEEPTGWEEPSPEPICHKLEIDDGTSAWGDPSKYNYKHVNMWNKNTPSSIGRSGQQVYQQVLSSSYTDGVESVAGSNSGWGESSPASATVDNGTSVWGKPADTGPSWEESISDTTCARSWGNASVGQQASNRTGPMQVSEGWCGSDMPLTGNQPASCEKEEVEIGTWNSNLVQDPSAPLHWPTCSKKLPSKGTVKNGNKPDEMWINPFVKQFANLGFSRGLPEEVMQSNKIDLSRGILPDKRIEVKKHNLNITEGSQVIGKSPGFRPHISKDSSIDGSPYFAKNDNPSAFGNFIAQPQNIQLSPAQLHSSQSHPCAQVPPPLPSPQVPVSLLKYAQNTGELNSLFGPQQVAMLDQFSQLQRLLAQQRKVQNQRSTPTSGHQEQQQQNRSLNMQQQVIPQSCQLDPNLLIKQQVPLSQKQFYQTAIKSLLENVVPHCNQELQKWPSQINAFSNFPMGLNANLNVNMDMGSIKEPRSRLRKWTTVESISTNTSLDQNASKNCAISSGFRMEEMSFLPYDFMSSSNSPASPPGSVRDGWPRAKSPNSSNSVNWPPEFCPGEPWKGYPNIDPEIDPYVTPGSVTNSLSINTVREADHLRDRNSGSSSALNTTLPSTSAWSSICASTYNVSLNSIAQSTFSARNSGSKSTWPPVSFNNTSLAHEPWKVPLPPKSITNPSRPPPGLTGQKLSLTTWDNSMRLGGSWSNLDARYTLGSSWNENSSSGRITNSLVLKNLTTQIDGSTLRTLCMQHGPLITFHLNLPHGNALVRYSSKEEVMKAQKSLHMCVLGNTTILAEFASEEEISRFFAQGPSINPSPAWQSLGISQNCLETGDSPHAFSNRSDLNPHWSSPGLSGTNSGDHHGASLWGSPNYTTTLWGSLGGSDTRGLGSPSPLNVFLSENHLGAGDGGGESM